MVFKGVAAYPKLLFDRREIIMPTVPLKIESRYIFRLINDGYENLKLNPRIVDECGNLDIKLAFPDEKIIGVSKNKVRVEVMFKSDKPISFVSKIEFLDDNQGKSYQIPISGTADNSIFTNFSYF